MIDNELLEKIIQQVIAEMDGKVSVKDAEDAVKSVISSDSDPDADEPLEDLRSKESKAVPLLKDPADYDALMRMKTKTSARIGVGRAGGRLNTKTLLTLRADHAAARDAVFTDVDENLLNSLNLFSVQTQCTDKNNFLTRPDLGKKLSEEAVETIKSKCAMNPDVEIYASDGLSSTAIAANIANILPAVTDGLKSRGITVGTPFFLKYGRVAAEDEISELLHAKVVCVFIGERPGLATAESMSAYIAYEARVGMPEARRTVVSNIHSGGISAVEAGAYIAELIEKILKAQKSGVELVN
ncbi:MAG: ethanolamine ammonia-lyase subunit EutC [Clostridiales bacterium]|nr:ethanolamine ammonia-lyase subunit EutC [Clostridiales bacterium]